MAFLSNSSSIIYYSFAAGIYACVVAILILALVFGRRARRNVKNEQVTKMPKGFSPLDVQRIFIGKTYPRRLTAALITHWAQMGYIKVEYVTPHTVILKKVKSMPMHYNDKAVFFDRGTYVRDREVFNAAMKKAAYGKPINIHLPLISKAEVTRISNKFAAREDEGVYSSTHYTLKVVTFVLSILPLLLSALLIGALTGMYFMLIMFFMALIGLIVLIFVKGMPILFKAVWCGMWLGVSIGWSIAMWVGLEVNDVLGVIYVAVTILFVGPIVLIRFVDYREKINLDEYSDLINYRKFLFKDAAYELNDEEYYSALPFLYAFNIKWIVGRKFKGVPPPKWYSGDPEGRGRLL
ncbi:MAG: DUF2207 domain-containing protein [Clostridiales bacterium]|nr:DUF2207 domain-containing protein [Clostridiales bacterium]